MKKLLSAALALLCLSGQAAFAQTAVGYQDMVGNRVTMKPVTPAQPLPVTCATCSGSGLGGTNTAAAPTQTEGSTGQFSFDLGGNLRTVPKATELHLGEVGGSANEVSVAQTVTAASAYTAGNAIGGLMTVANAARVSGTAGASGTTGMVQSVVVASKSAQTSQIDVFLFNASPTGSTCTDKTAFALAAADIDKVIGVASIPATTGWFSGGTASVGQVLNLAKTYALSSATSIFACAVTRATPTFTATSDIVVHFGLVRN